VEIFSFGRSLSRTSTLLGQGTLPSPTTGCRIRFPESLLMLEATLNNVGVSSNVAAKIPNQIPAPFSDCRRLRLATAGDDKAHTVARFFVRFFHEMHLQAR
jgi:hypothetical protein